MSRNKAWAAAIGALLVAASCGSSAKKPSASPATTAGPGTTASGPTGTTAPAAPNGVVTISNAQGQTWTCGFNPFNPAVNTVSMGFVYEPLVYVNALKNSAETPMLASSYQWSTDKKTLTFTIRDGVKWSDGQPLTGDDVAFTFNLMKAKPALDLNSLWSAGLTSVTASGNQVVMSFTTPAQPYFYYIADQTGIVPQHIWSTGDAAKDPVQYQDADPIGSGPFVVKPCTANLITYVANTTYWQPGLPKIAKVQYPAYTDNGPANLDLANDTATWGSQFIPGVQKFYVDKDPTNHHIWFPPVTNVDLFFNLKHAATGKLAVRQAFAYGIDRASVSKIGESGYQPAANQTGIVLPTYQGWYDSTATGQYGLDTQKAGQLLASAGYSPSHPLKLTVITISGYTDWDASLAEIKQELKPIGIDLSVNDLAQTTYNDMLFKGNFDLAYGAETGGPAPYYELRQLLYGANSAPLGQNASTNYERFGDPAIDALFDQYASADDAGQHTIIKQIEQTMLTTVPVVPTTESVDWYEYNTKHLSGWPTPDNPYAQPAAFNVPDVEQVLLHLQYN